MKVFFGQIYIEPGIRFPFSHHFQRRLSEEITALVQPSDRFVKKYGKDYELMIRISAKTDIDDNEIRGPSVYRKTKDVEYSVFLPFDVITKEPEVLKSAVRYIINGTCSVFDLLEIDTSQVLERQGTLIEDICSDSTMIAEPRWDSKQE